MQLLLAAEDDPSIRQLLDDVLTEVPGWSFSAVGDGALLLEALETVVPALVILDLKLPGIDGLTLYAILRKRECLRGMPVLFLTALPQQVEDAQLAGPHAVLGKPFDVDDLLAKVAAMLGETTPRI